MPSFVHFLASASRAPSGASWMCHSIAVTEDFPPPASSGRSAPEYYSPMGIVQAGDGPLSNWILLAARASLEAAPGRQIAAHAAARDEVETGVRVRRRDEVRAVAVEEHLEHREEALEIRLLVDREVEM